MELEALFSNYLRIRRALSPLGRKRKIRLSQTRLRRGQYVRGAQRTARLASSAKGSASCESVIGNLRPTVTCESGKPSWLRNWAWVETSLKRRSPRCRASNRRGSARGRSRNVLAIQLRRDPRTAEDQHRTLALRIVEEVFTDSCISGGSGSSAATRSARMRCATSSR